MSRRLQIAFVFASITLATAACVSRGSAQTAAAEALPSSVHAPEVGQKVPEILLLTPDGEKVRSAELMRHGTLVVVVLRGYPGYQCPYCVKQVRDFEQSADQFRAAGAEILLVYPGPPAELDQRAKEFLAKENPLPGNVHLVVDPDYAFTNRFGLRWDAPHETAYPSTFLTDQNGVIYFRKISGSHGDRTTAAEILKIVEQHKAGR